MQKQRLLKLAAYLRNYKEATAPVKFNMSSFGETKIFDSEISFKNGVPVVKEGFCNTSACALGHAALMPEFQKAGLHIDWDMQDDGRHGTARVRLKNRAIYDEFEVASEFFGISEYQSEYLFGAFTRSPKQEAQIIEDFVKTGKTPNED